MKRLFWFAKTVINELDQRIHGCLFITAIGFQCDFAALAGSQHHHAHDALGIDPATITLDPDFTGMLAGSLRQLSRCAGMQTQFIDDFYFLFNHDAYMRPWKNVPPRRAHH